MVFLLSSWKSKYIYNILKLYQFKVLQRNSLKNLILNFELLSIQTLWNIYETIMSSRQQSVTSYTCPASENENQNNIDQTEKETVNLIETKHLLEQKTNPYENPQHNLLQIQSASHPDVSTHLIQNPRIEKQQQFFELLSLEQGQAENERLKLQ